MARQQFDDFNEDHLFKNSSNPLAQYFRLPGLHVKLPTRGAFLPAGTVTMTLTDDIPVMPMRAADEVLLKNPDALMSGYALEKLLESCVPTISAPLEISAPDLDVLLLAIRAASYGETMDTDAVCPKCKHDNGFQVHLPSMLADMTFIDAENPVRLTDEIVLYLRPYTVRHASRLSLATFQEARTFQAIRTQHNAVVEQAKEAGTPAAEVKMLESRQAEERAGAMNDGMKRIQELETELMADCIIKVVTPSAVVVEKNYIQEFAKNIARGWTKKIEAKLAEINERGLNKKIHLTCHECGHEWNSDIEFNPVNFFDQGS